MLGQVFLERAGDEQFPHLAPRGARGGEVEVFGQLLGDGARPAHDFPFFEVELHRFPDLGVVDPLVLEEGRVLAHQDRVFEVGGDGGEGAPLLPAPHRALFFPGFPRAQLHPGGRCGIGARQGGRVGEGEPFPAEPGGAQDQEEKEEVAQFFLHVLWIMHRFPRFRRPGEKKSGSFRGGFIREGMEKGEA